MDHFSTNFVIEVDIIATTAVADHKDHHTTTATGVAHHSFIAEVADHMDQTDSIVVNVIRSELLVLKGSVDTAECCSLDHKLVELAVNIRVVVINTAIDSFDIDLKQVVVLKVLHLHRIGFLTIVLMLLRKAFMLLVAYLNYWFLNWIY